MRHFVFFIALLFCTASAAFGGVCSNTSLGQSFTCIQSTFAHSGSNPTTVAYPSNLGAGHLLIVVVWGGAGPSVPTDTLSQTYIQAVTVNETLAPGFGTIYYLCNSLSGADTVSEATVGGGGLSIFEISGGATANCLDEQAGAVQSAATSWDSGNTPTTTQASELLFGFLFNDNTANAFTQGTGWTALEVDTVDGASSFMMTEYKTVSATGAYDATGSVASSSYGTASIATFKAAAAGGGNGGGIGGKAGFGGKGGRG